MANDIIFKTKAFGGFNKEEVMTYINRLISEKEELENKCKALTEEKNNLKNEVSEISQKLKTAEDKAESEIKEREDVLKILDAEREIRDAVCKEKDEFGFEILKLNK